NSCPISVCHDDDLPPRLVGQYPVMVGQYEHKNAQNANNYHFPRNRKRVMNVYLKGQVTGNRIDSLNVCAAHQCCAVFEGDYATNVIGNGNWGLTGGDALNPPKTCLNRDGYDIDGATGEGLPQHPLTN